MTRVLFLCSHNSARSQMAEGFLRAWAGRGVEAASAGTTARGVHPLAVRAMAEVGVDISDQRSKTVDDVPGAFDVVVTVCDTSCPIPPRTKLLLRWKFADPSAAGGSEEDQLAAFRLVRDGIGRRVRALVRRLGRRGISSAALTAVASSSGSELPPRPGEHPPSERRAEIGLPKDEPAKPRPAPEPQPRGAAD